LGSIMLHVHDLMVKESPDIEQIGLFVCLFV